MFQHLSFFISFFNRIILHIFESFIHRLIHINYDTIKKEDNFNNYIFLIYVNY